MNLRKLKSDLKVFLQTRYLPAVYQREVKGSQIQKDSILFASSNSSRLSSNMQPVYDRLVQAGYHPGLYLGCLPEMSPVQGFHFLKDFMKLYARTEYVFLDNYFVPVSSCKKRKGTKVIQLWHAAGALKKTGYDAEDDIPANYRGTPSRNFDLVTVSSPAVRPNFMSAFRLTDSQVKATGIARTDLYFDPELNRQKRDRFFQKYPEARGKKIAVYAPSFTGNAGTPRCEGLESGIVEVFRNVRDTWFLVVSLHPRLRRQYPAWDIPFATSDLFPAADLLITDYSSVIFDYLLYGKSFLFYAPDYDTYKVERGFYHDLSSFPVPLVRNAGELAEILSDGRWQTDKSSLEDCCQYYMQSCDGHSTERILKEAGFSLPPAGKVPSGEVSSPSDTGTL